MEGVADKAGLGEENESEFGGRLGDSPDSATGRGGSGRVGSGGVGKKPCEGFASTGPAPPNPHLIRCTCRTVNRTCATPGNRPQSRRGPVGQEGLIHYHFSDRSLPWERNLQKVSPPNPLFQNEQNRPAGRIKGHIRFAPQEQSSTGETRIVVTQFVCISLTMIDH
jgi:hypothetical protein